MKKFRLMVLLALGLVLCAVPLRAQEDVGTDEDKFSFGKIVSVSASQVTVKEYDFAKDADVDVVYDVTAETELGNVNAVTDLVVGDDIVLDYSEKDGRRVVATLVKEEAAPEGEAMDEEAPMDGAVADELPMVEAPVVEAAPVVNAEAPVQP